MTDQDKELLTLAAKALGHSLHFDKQGNPMMSDNGCFGNGFVGMGFMEQWQPWNPLTKTQDAMGVAIHFQWLLDCTNEYPGVEHPLGRTHEQPVMGDTAAALRRAIVRTAAEIGRSM